MLRKGRLGEKVDITFAEYTSSLEFDRKIFLFDILGSIAHAIMLLEAKIISKEDASKIINGLLEILDRGIEALDLDPRLEDIHMAIEKKLIEKAGEAGGKLHVARSRNDQVACDLRLWIREEINEVSKLVLKLIGALLKLCEDNVNTVMPGYTHLQRAQPTTLAHHFLSYVDMFIRDFHRLSQVYERTNKNPLGACALATTSFDISRELTTKLLGFSDVIENSMDAVSARDYMLELASCLAILMVNVSRICEELILWSSQEFNFIELSDELSSTSSIMPQKKNPDALEIMRARTSKVIGNLTSALSLIKALPQSYNRDFQELSPIIADSLEIANTSLSLLNKIISTIKINKEKMRRACDELILATDLADFLVIEEAISFREAHRIVASSISAGNLSSLFELYKKKKGKALTPEEAIELRRVRGGPSSREVKRMLSARKETLAKLNAKLKKRMEKIEKNKENLIKKAEELCIGVKQENFSKE